MLRVCTEKGTRDVEARAKCFLIDVINGKVRLCSHDLPVDIQTAAYSI